MSVTPPPHDTSPPLTALLGFWLEGPLYGLNVALYACCARIMLKDSRDSRRHLLLGLATFQLLIATAHVIVFLLFLKEGFITHANNPGGSAAYFADTSTPIYAAQLFFYMTNFFIADGIMAWRCYVVWSHNIFIAAFYVATVLGTSIAGYSAIAHIRDATNIFTAVRWMTSMFSLSLVTQVTATFFICVKLWMSRAPFTRREQMGIIWMIVESGAVLTASTLTVFVLYLLGFNAGQLVSEMAAQLSCMIPTSIIVRVGMKRTAEKKRSQQAYNSSDVVRLERHRRGLESESIGSQQNVDGPPFAVTITTTTTDDAKSVALGDSTGTFKSNV